MIKEIFKGESCTLMFTFPEAYDMGRIDSHKVYIGIQNYVGVVDGQSIVLKLKSSDTDKLCGVQKIVLWFNDSTLGLRKPYCGDLVITKTKAEADNESESDIYDIIIPIIISETSVTVGDILYNYVKGANGSNGRGISNLELISTVGLVKTYRITYTDNTTFEYSVSDGENPTNQNVIAAIGFTPENTANKQNSLTHDGTGAKFPTVDSINAAFKPVVISTVTPTGDDIVFTGLINGKLTDCEAKIEYGLTESLGTTIDLGYIAAPESINETVTISGFWANFYYKITAQNSIALNEVLGHLTNSFQNYVEAWQASTDYVRVGGLLESTWNATNDWHSNRTVIIPRRAIFSKTTINNIRIYPKTVTGAAWKLKIFRWNTTTSLYDFIRESTFTPVGTSAQTCVLTTPLEADVMDIIGLYIPTGNTIWSDASTIANPSTRNVNSTDVTTSNAFTGTTDVVPCVDVFGTRPYISIGGDSIISGFNGGSASLYYVPIWGSVLGLKTIPGGNTLYEPFYYSKGLIGSFLSYQNHGNTNTKWSDALSTYVPNLLAAKPNTIVLAWGTNDIMANVTWSTVLGQLDSIKALIDVSTVKKTFICEILPRTQFNDVMAATVRTWNANLAAWCTANNCTLITCHDDMGKIRTSTNQIDDLKTEYNADGTHLTVAGVAKFGEIISQYIGT